MHRATLFPNVSISWFVAVTLKTPSYAWLWACWISTVFYLTYFFFLDWQVRDHPGTEELHQWVRREEQREAAATSWRGRCWRSDGCWMRAAEVLDKSIDSPSQPHTAEDYPPCSLCQTGATLKRTFPPAITFLFNVYRGHLGSKDLSFLTAVGVRWVSWIHARWNKMVLKKVAYGEKFYSGLN